MQRDGGLDAFDVQLAQGPLHRGDGLPAGRLVNDQLADHRIVIGRDDVASWTCESKRTPNPPGTRNRVIVPGVGRKFFSGSSALMRHSMAAPLLADVLLPERQLLARRHANLRLDQVDAGDHLRHRMLDLDAGVHLDEVEVARRIDDELDRAGVGVLGGADQPDGRLADGRRGSGDRAAGRDSPRPASGAAAASSNRARRGGPRCRACRRASALRRGGDARCIFPGRCRRCRRPPRPRPGPAGWRPSGPDRSGPRACRVRRRRPPP